MKYLAYFWTRKNGELETVEIPVDREREAKEIAVEQNMRFVGIERNTPEYQEKIAAEKQRNSRLILHFANIASGEKLWWQDIP